MYFKKKLAATKSTYCKFIAMFCKIKMLETGVTVSTWNLREGRILQSTWIIAEGNRERRTGHARILIGSLRKPLGCNTSDSGYQTSPVKSESIDLRKSLHKDFTLSSCAAPWALIRYLDVEYLKYSRVYSVSAN